MSGQHTPGPWRLNAGNDTEIMAAGLNVARAHCGGMTGIKLAEAEANARLIAASPELLAAAIYARECLLPYKDDDFAWSGISQLVAAISKALGTA